MKNIKAKSLIITFLLIILLSSCNKESSFPSTPELIKNKNEFSILWVGNSHTFTGDIPGQFSKISGIYGITVNYDTIIKGGAKLNQLMNQTIEKIQSNNYDYVILQDYGGRPATNEKADFYSDVESLCEEAREFGVIPILYNPAFRYSDEWPDKKYQAILTSTHESAAKMNGALFINAADAWVYAYDKHPGLDLFIPGDFHASDAGAYLTACVFVSALFDLHVKDNITEDGVYNGDNALSLGKAAWEFVSYYNENKKSPQKVVTVPDGTNEKVKS